MNPDYVLLYENEFVNSLYPFTVLHLQWEVRVGAFKLYEKIQKEFPNSTILFSSQRKKYLQLFFKKTGFRNSLNQIGNFLVLNAGILPSKELWEDLKYNYKRASAKSVVFYVNNVPIGLFLDKSDVINPVDFDLEFYPILLRKYYEKLPKVFLSSFPKVINFLWDAIEYNSIAIADDFRFFKNFADLEKLRANNVSIIEKGRVKIGKETIIRPFVVIDASNGPVILGDNVHIDSFVKIQGPVYIGDHSQIKPNSFIHQGTSIGPVCKIGGEVENSIIHSYSNKQHEGFLGHSYICEWVNIGAGTLTSDLKNTYETVKVRIWNETFDTGRTFLGLICGDHTKTAIGTTFNTGTIVGAGCNIYHSGLLPKFIPSFTWGGDRLNSHIGSFDKTIETAKIMMARRNIELLPEEIQLLQLEYVSTEGKKGFK